MGDFTDRDLVCIGRIFSQTSLELEIFSPTHNGVRFYFNIVRHERYFFSVQDIFFGVIYLHAFFLSKSVRRTFLF